MAGSCNSSDDLKLDRQMRHHIEVVVDRLVAARLRGRGWRKRSSWRCDWAKGILIVATARRCRRPADERNRKRSRKAMRLRNAARAATQAANRRAQRGRHRVFSAHYACTHCGLSFESPSPQLFSFNSPQGMCRQCDGLGEIYGFDVARMVPDPELTFKEGCFELIGLWKDMGRWRRHIYQGVADTIERLSGLPHGTMLETPWNNFRPELQNIWLWGTGEQHITFTWRNGAHGQKYGGKFEGHLAAIAVALSDVEKPHPTAAVGKIHERCALRRLRRSAAQPASPIGDAHLARKPKFADRPERSLPEVVQSVRGRRGRVFRRFESRSDRADDRCRVGEGNSRPARVSCQRRPGVSDARSHRPDAFRRRIATYPPRRANRLRPGRRALHSRRAFDRPASAQQSKAARHAHAIARQGQHRLVVEHDEDTMRAADTIVDFGPGPGVRGGHLVAQGNAAAIARRDAKRHRQISVGQAED